MVRVDVQREVVVGVVICETLRPEPIKLVQQSI